MVCLVCNSCRVHEQYWVCLYGTIVLVGMSGKQKTAPFESLYVPIAPGK